MASTLIQAADAIVAHIAAQTPGDTINQEVTAVRKYVARYDLTSLISDTKARVTVVPYGMKTRKKDGKRAGTRGSVPWIYSIDVALHQTATNDATTDLAIELYEQINDLFAESRLPGLTGLWWIDSEQVAIYDPQTLDENKTFLAVQRLMYGGGRV